MSQDALLTATLVVCALVTTGLVVYRELFARAPGPVQLPTQELVFIQDWRSHLGKGVQLGRPEAPVQLIEFADFECPFCATLHKTIKTLRDQHPTEVTLNYVHFPLPGHRFAEPAARVAECADEQGRFEAMHDLLFEQQNAFGLKPWSEFAADAGVPDAAAFESCIQKKNPVPRIAEGRQLGDQLSIQGTPTLIVNGWKLARPPGAEQLDRMITAILAGKSPVSSDGKPVE